MPKVSDKHRQRQADRICAAAERCFARSGFHATTMDDIITETDMSSSTVYRYFPAGKQQLIDAVSAARIGPVIGHIATFADDDEPPSLEQVFLAEFGLLVHHSATVTADDPDALIRSARLAVALWDEAGHDSQLAAMLKENYDGVSRQLARLVRRWQANGTVIPTLDPTDVVALILNAMFGLIVEQAITGNADIPTAAKLLDKILTLQPAPAEHV